MTLSRKLYDKGVKDATSLAALIAKEKGEYTFAHTFPTGTHAMWPLLLARDLRRPSV